MATAELAGVNFLYRHDEILEGLLCCGIQRLGEVCCRSMQKTPGDVTEGYTVQWLVVQAKLAIMLPAGAFEHRGPSDAANLVTTQEFAILCGAICQ